MLEILISSSVLILVLAILRLVLRNKISARLQYALWLLVLVRLLVPVSFFHSSVSVTEAVWPVTDSVRGYSLQTGALPTDALSDSVTQNLHRLGVHPEWEEYVSDGAGGSRIQNYYSVRQIGHLVWGGGSAVMAAWFLFLNLRMARRLKKRRTMYDSAAKPPVYVAENIPSPCLFGLRHPAIYLTERAAEDDAQAEQIIAHERTHLRHGDLIWAFLRSVCLAVWWFNPLVWLAAALSRQDCELACDEGTIKALGEEARFDYGRTLVSMTAVGVRPSDLLCGATTMTGGKKSLKARVARIAGAPKISVIAVILALCVAAAAVGCTFSGAAEKTAETQDTPVPMIVVNGRLYCSTGEQLPMEVDPSAYAGGIASVVPLSEQPTEDDQANFGEVGDPYIMQLSGPVVLMDNEWTRFVSADAANYLDPAPAPEVIADGVISAEVWGEGRTAELTEAEELKQLLTVMESIEFQQTFDLDHAYAPGAQSVGVTLSYEDGSEVRWTYPVMMYNGAIFKSENQSAGTIGSFLYPEPSSEELTAGSADASSSGEASSGETSEREVGQVLSGFVGTVADVEVDISDDFPVDETAEPRLLQEYIYGINWEFDYSGQAVVDDHDPYAWIKITDVDGTVLWIMDGADALLIERTDGTVISATAASGGLDTTDMINHLLPWARGEYSEMDLLLEIYASAEPDTQAALARIGDYGLSGKEPEFVFASDGETLTAELTGQAGTPVTGVTKSYNFTSGPDYEGYWACELHYERYWSDDTRTESITPDIYNEMRENYRSLYGTYSDALVGRQEGFAWVMAGQQMIMWYDAERDLIFSLLSYAEVSNGIDEPLLESMLALAESIE